MTADLIGRFFGQTLRMRPLGRVSKDEAIELEIVLRDRRNLV